MLSLFLRHYRRFTAFSLGLACLGPVMLRALGFTPSLIGTLSIIFAAFLASVFLGALMYILAPRRRGCLEIAGMGALVTAGLLYFTFPTSFSPLIAVGCAVGLWGLTSVGIGAALHGKHARKIGTLTSWRDRYSGHIPYPARLIWRHVVPGAADPSDHCTGMMAKYDEDLEDPDTVHVTFKGRKGRAAEYSLTFLERDEPSACRFFFQGNEADGTFVDGVFSLRTTTLDRDSCFVSCVEERSGLSIGKLVERWFDDALGYQHDRLVDILDRLYGETYGQTKAGLTPAE